MMIIKYYEWMRISPDEKQIVYEACKRDPEAAGGVRTLRRLDKDEAKRLIQSHELHIVHRNRYGTIWE